MFGRGCEEILRHGYFGLGAPMLQDPSSSKPPKRAGLKSLSNRKLGLSLARNSLGAAGAIS